LVVDRVEIGSGEPFDRMQLLGRGQSEIVDPDAFVVADRIDDERVAFPMPDRVSTIARRKVRRVRPPVCVNRSEAMCSTGFENVEALMLSIIDELCAIGCRDLPRAGG